ncbi:MAG: MFS transporter [Bryobacterales bacterium]|nr:MFS transporter [Bryobacterales bacterium]
MVHAVQRPPGLDSAPGVMQTSMAGRGMSGVVVSGLLFAFLGAILPAWRYHIELNFLIIGTYFLCQNLGVLLAPLAGLPLLRHRGIGFTLSLGCALAGAALLLLAAFSPPAHYAWRMAGLFLLGFSAGLLNISAFHAITPAYELHPAVTLNLAGALFGFGCLLCALFLAGTFFVYTVPSVLILMAMAPIFAAVHYARAQLPPDPVVQQPSLKETLKDFKSPAAILFAMLLFFQFGNEGALAGWLALFLIQRLGISPETSLFLLALYWGSLLIGRVVAQSVLPRVSHARLLTGAVLVPMFACLALFFTNNLFGATLGVLLAGGGFSVILPLVMERIGSRFPYFHPGFFNGIFSVALTGGMLAPASLGYIAHYLGMGAVMGLPLIGSILVFLLLLLILLEGKLSGRSAQQSS